MHWRKTAILGVGLLGGSLGLALRRRALTAEVHGFVRRDSTLKEAIAAGAITTGSSRLEEVVPGADLVVICTPLAQIPALAAALSGILDAGALVTDVGSAKAAVIGAAEEPIRKAGGHFVGSHPMTGSERSGVSSAREDLFAGAITVVTPTTSSDADAVSRTVGLWESVSSRVVTMPAADHDELVSRGSHLPHLVAAALASYVLEPGRPAEQALLCASGFRDTTRVASGSPEMWRDIALANRREILSALDGFGSSLAVLREAVAKADGAAIEEFLVAAKRRRDGWSCNGGRGATE